MPAPNPSCVLSSSGIWANDRPLWASVSSSLKQILTLVMASMLWRVEGGSEATTNWQLKLSANSTPGVRTHQAASALPSPESSFSCYDSWARCVLGPMAKGSRSHHTTKGGGDKIQRGLQSVPVGLRLALVLPLCPCSSHFIPIFPSRRSSHWTSSWLMRAPKNCEHQK